MGQILDDLDSILEFQLAQYDTPLSKDAKEVAIMRKDGKFLNLNMIQGDHDEEFGNPEVEWKTTPDFEMLGNINKFILSKPEIAEMIGKQCKSKEDIGWDWKFVSKERHEDKLGRFQPSSHGSEKPAAFGSQSGMSRVSVGAE